jgi:soluble lytic murein transglycosylase-like protein
MAKKQNDRVLKDIKAALKLFPKIVKQKETAYREKARVLKNFAPLARELFKLTRGKTSEKLHPWRRCRTNPSRKDQLYPDEMMAIANEHFSGVEELPASDKLDQSAGHDFDRIIAGWTRYWNDVLKPETPLDPNLVKALISTESDFDVKAKALASPGNFAHGLMQVTDETIAILKSQRGELKDFLIHIDQGDAYDPNLNICAGIRWLFHKKTLLEKKRKKSVSWESAIMDYKGYTKGLRNKEQRATQQWNKTGQAAFRGQK